MALGVSTRWRNDQPGYRVSPPTQREVLMAHKFEIYKDKAGEFRVRFKYNSETMFSTEGYASKASAQNAIDSIKKNGPDAPIEDNS
jgi:uncharacterized protein YegP (UPF0339 family)